MYPAPRSNDASVSAGSNSTNLARIIGIANPNPIIVCPEIKLVYPKGILKKEKILRTLTAIIISGRIILV